MQKGRSKPPDESTAEKRSIQMTQPSRDDTGYISPYRRRLQARAGRDRPPHANPQLGPNSEDYRVAEGARKQLTEIHSATRRKDGARRGRGQ